MITHRRSMGSRGKERLSKLQGWILLEISRERTGSLNREEIRERLARGDSRAKERGKGLWALEALRATFRGNLSRTMGNLIEKGWIAGGEPRGEIRITEVGRRVLAERTDPWELFRHPRRRKDRGSRKARRRWVS